MFGFRRAKNEPAARLEPAARPEPAKRPEPVRAGNRRRAPLGGRPGAPQAIAGACDRCPAAAAVRARLPSNAVLMLCGHHGRRYAPALRVQGAVITGDLAFPIRRAQTAPVKAR